jgi:hypothetical protein
MKRMMIIGASLMALILIGSTAVMSGQMPMGSQGGQQEQPYSQQPMIGSIMGMTCPMMSGMMGGQMDPSGMMGMMSGGQMDPKAMARMLKFRSGHEHAPPILDGIPRRFPLSLPLGYRGILT